MEFINANFEDGVNLFAQTIDFIRQHPIRATIMLGSTVVTTWIIWCTVAFLIFPNCPEITLRSYATREYDIHQEDLPKDVLFFYASNINNEVQFNQIVDIDQIQLDLDRFIICVHGYASDGLTGPCLRLAKEYLKLEDAPYFVSVDWKTYAMMELDIWNYYKASKSVSYVGQCISKFVSDVLSVREIEADQIECLGHSLGSHACGISGKILNSRNQTMGKVVGLDPAGPVFSNLSPEHKVYRNDAHMVVLYHSSVREYRALTILLGFLPLGNDGMDGDVDVILNSGFHQPGCGHKIAFSKFELFLDVACSHSRVIDVFSETVYKNQWGLKGAFCRSREEAVFATCYSDNEITVGDEMGINKRYCGSKYCSNAFQVPLVLQVLTNDCPPFVKTRKQRRNVK